MKPSNEWRIGRIVTLGVLGAAVLAAIGATIWNAHASVFTYAVHALIVFAGIGAVLAIFSLPAMMIGFIHQGRKQ